MPLVSEGGSVYWGSLIEKVKSAVEEREWTCQCSGNGRFIKRPSGVEWGFEGSHGVRDVVFARSVQSGVVRSKVVVFVLSASTLIKPTSGMRISKA